MPSLQTKPKLPGLRAGREGEGKRGLVLNCSLPCLLSPRPAFFTALTRSLQLRPIRQRLRLRCAVLTRAGRCSRCSRVGSGGPGLPPAFTSGSRAPASDAWWTSRSRSKRNSRLVAVCGVPQEACALSATCTGWDGVSAGRGSQARSRLACCLHTTAGRPPV